MFLAIDSLAERYGMLPSQVMEQASTFDLYVINASMEWRSRQQALAEGGYKSAPHLSQETMKEMLESLKQGKENGKI
jgi:hypothetical protein